MRRAPAPAGEVVGAQRHAVGAGPLSGCALMARLSAVIAVPSPVIAARAGDAQRVGDSVARSSVAAAPPVTMLARMSALVRSYLRRGEASRWRRGHTATR